MGGRAHLDEGPAAALTIAGSDPSGGAGIQEDLRVFAALGVAGMSAISAVTVQSSLGVESVHPVAPDLLYDQIRALLEDSPVRSVKIGMLGDEAQVRAVAAALRRFQPPNIVLDPVLDSTGGVPLLSDSGVRSLRAELMPLCRLITPNVPELGRLASMPTDRFGDRERAVRELQRRGARAVLVTGGHLPCNPVDSLFLESGEVRRFPGLRVETRHTHGAGCLLSAAIAAGLALGGSLESAAEEAKELITEALRRPAVFGRGRGHPDVTAAKEAVRRRRETRNEQHVRRTVVLVENPVYVITDPDLRPDRSHEEIVTAALSAGARVIQLRDKHLADPALVALGRKLAGLVHAVGGILMVNDRADIAVACGADGVHLGPADLDPMDARSVIGPEKLIGVSVGTVKEGAAFAGVASYLAGGAVFGSSTKLDAGGATGLQLIRALRKSAPRQIPIVAIGGINLSNIGLAAAAGADSAAVISAVVNSPDMELAVRELMSRFREGVGCRGQFSRDSSGSVP